MLHALIQTLKAYGLIQKDTVVIFLGDYIDRGPDSKGVLDYLSVFQYTHPRVFCIMGNHEEMAVSGAVGIWRDNGGQATLDSFGGVDELPSNYVSQIQAMVSYVRIGKLLFTHATPDFKKPIPSEQDSFRDRDDIRWNRSENSANHPWDLHLVFGHTPTLHKNKQGLERYDASDRHTNLDTGVRKNRALSAGVFDAATSKRECILTLYRKGDDFSVDVVTG